MPVFSGLYIKGLKTFGAKKAEKVWCKSTFVIGEGIAPVAHRGYTLELNKAAELNKTEVRLDEATNEVRSSQISTERNCFDISYLNRKAFRKCGSFSVSKPWYLGSILLTRFEIFHQIHVPDISSCWYYFIS